MPDFTMCGGFNCSFKELCYRYRAVPSSVRQSWFAEKPNLKKDMCFCRIESFHKIREIADIEKEKLEVTLEVQNGVIK